MNVKWIKAFLIFLLVYIVGLLVIVLLNAFIWQSPTVTAVTDAVSVFFNAVNLVAITMIYFRSYLPNRERLRRSHVQLVADYKRLINVYDDFDKFGYLMQISRPVHPLGRRDYFGLMYFLGVIVNLYFIYDYLF